MMYLNLLLIPAILLLPLPGLAGPPGAGEQPKASVEARVKAAAAGLQSEDQEQRLRAAVELLRLGKQAEPAAPQLIAALCHDDGDQMVAVLALGQIGEPAVKPLVALLREAPDPKRSGPLLALTWMGPKAREAVPAVRELLGGKNRGLAAQAAYALARMSPSNRGEAIEALQRMITNEPSAADAALLLLAWLRPEDPGPLVPALVNQLRSDSCMFKQLSWFLGAYGLAELGPTAKEAIPALRASVKDREGFVGVLAAYALAEASPADRPLAVRVLLDFAGKKPGPESMEFQAGAESKQTYTEAQVDAAAAVVDVLLTQEPGNRFPTSFLLTWVKRGLRQHHGEVGPWLKASPLSTCLAAEAVRRLDPEAAKKANLLPPKAGGALTPKEIMAKVEHVYATCRSYRDSGTVVMKNLARNGRGEEERASFTTAFVRPDAFRFDYQYSREDKEEHLIVWAKGAGVKAWWPRDPKGELLGKPESLAFALNVVTGVTQRTSTMIPDLLLPDPRKGESGHLAHAELKLLPDASVADREFFRVERKYESVNFEDGARFDVIEVYWVEKTTFLVRKQETEMKASTFSFRTTISYTPKINTDIPAKALEFNPPVAK